MAALSIYTAVYVTKTAFKRLIPSVKGCAGSSMVKSFLHTQRRARVHPNVLCQAGVVNSVDEVA